MKHTWRPPQFPEKLVPKLTLLAARRAPLPIHGDGRATRSYLHVDDVVAAYDVVLHRGTVGQTYNIGTQRERGVLDGAQRGRRGGGSGGRAGGAPVAGGQALRRLGRRGRSALATATLCLFIRQTTPAPLHLCSCGGHCGAVWAGARGGGGAREGSCLPG